MSFIGKFLTKSAKIFDIDRSTSTPTGQPLESLVQVDTIDVFFNPKQRRDFGLFNTGQVTIGQFFALGLSELIVPQQIMEIESVKYRVVAVNTVEFQRCKPLFFKYWLDLFQHN